MDRRCFWIITTLVHPNFISKMKHIKCIWTRRFNKQIMKRKRWWILSHKAIIFWIWSAKIHNIENQTLHYWPIWKSKKRHLARSTLKWETKGPSMTCRQMKTNTSHQPQNSQPIPHHKRRSSSSQYHRRSTVQRYNKKMANLKRIKKSKTWSKLKSNKKMNWFYPIKVTRKAFIPKSLRVPSMQTWVQWKKSYSNLMKMLEKNWTCRKSIKFWSKIWWRRMVRAWLKLKTRNQWFWSRFLRSFASDSDSCSSQFKCGLLTSSSMMRNGRLSSTTFLGASPIGQSRNQ